MKENLPVVSDNLSHYLAQIKQYPLLSPEEEFALAARYRETEDMEIAHQLITSNLRFVVKVSLEYRGYGLKLLDIIQEGNIGLMVALKKFDPHKGYRFISYAIWWIRAYIQNFIIRSWSLVKMGTTQIQKKLFYKMGRIKGIAHEEHQEEKIEELAQELNVRGSDIEEMQKRFAGRDLSLDAKLDFDQGISFLDLLPDLSPDQEELLGESEEDDVLKDEVEAALGHLSERERFIVSQRIMADDPMTLQELGDTFQISRERVRQIEGEALRKLKNQLASAESTCGMA
ncbi:MAG: RNA polymerase subunit sigma-70 [Deltaproteobacteria bacterium RBG_16_54_11]|jgi:RNA polymerase sigma-32 factor|nr:MAG: RNA polymerase subunit sigma-70 [Deltaproteobacteria bacterium RBG_16_54_11]